jgi:hypothetical protein
MYTSHIGLPAVQSGTLFDCRVRGYLGPGVVAAAQHYNRAVDYNCDCLQRIDTWWLAILVSGAQVRLVGSSGHAGIIHYLKPHAPFLSRHQLITCNPTINALLDSFMFEAKCLQVITHQQALHKVWLQLEGAPKKGVNFVENLC